MDWTALLPLYLTATVEWVEAFTIVLAVSLTIGWGASLGAAAAGPTLNQNRASRAAFRNYPICPLASGPSKRRSVCRLGSLPAILEHQSHP